MEPPVAPKRPHRLERHGDVRIDDYYWLRERDDPEVTAYLKAENAYLDHVLAHTRAFQDELFEEIKGRIKQTDMSVPYQEGTHLYYWRYETGQEYRLYCRRSVDSAARDEQVMLDVNAWAKGHEFCDVEVLDVSPDEGLLAFAVDTVGRRQYQIRFCDLASGETLPDVIEGATANAVWANDSRTLCYTRQHPETLRAFQVFRHTLGDDVAADTLVYEETDDTFSCGVGRSRSKRYILIGSYHSTTTEYRYLDADRPSEPVRVFLPRQRDHEYHLEHFRERFYIRTNREARNFKLMVADDASHDQADWRAMIPHRDDVLLETYELFRDHLVSQERVDGLVRLVIRPWDGSGSREVQFPEPAYDAYIEANNRVIDTHQLRYGYSSLCTPESTYDYDMRTGQEVLLKRKEVLGAFTSDDYRVERLHATAPDGVRIPISLVARRDTRPGDPRPLLLYGYGSYGISMDADFSSPRLSLLDRGFVFAIAHVRGGEELGRRWYDEGKLLKKKNTFTDFVACAERLVELGYTAPDRLFAMGGSAGGLLMGAVMNMRPALFCGVVAHVPFVDVVTTMLDESIPLTTGEYDEWGNPGDPTFYDYIKSYSPYDNVSAHAYPHLLVMTGYHDSQVQYWEPAKWVAKLRALNAGDARVLLKTNMDAGHGGASGRFRRYRETALQYAFLLDLAHRVEAH